MRVRYRASAKADLARIHAFIARDNPPAAKRVIRRIREQVRTIATFPEKHRTGDVDGTRELVENRYGYIVVFLVDGNWIDIVSVYHASEDRDRGPR